MGRKLNNVFGYHGNDEPESSDENDNLNDNVNHQLDFELHPKIERIK